MENLIFSCRRCGYCCQGHTTVSLDPADIERMLAYLHMDFEEASKKYLRVTGNVIQMQTIDGHCIFYNQGCTIHPGRPWRCRQWPLHPSILSDAANFEAIGSSCPGIRKELGYEEFCRILAGLIDRQNSTGKDRAF